MAGVTTYKQPISRTMDHNVNIIVNDNVTKDDKEKSLKAQNTLVPNLSMPGLDDTPLSGLPTDVEVQNTAQVEEIEEDVLYDDIDTKQSTGLKITWRPWTAVYDIELFFHGRNRTDDSEFKFEPHQFSKLEIEENFVENFADHVSVTVTLTPSEILLLMDNYRNLKAHIYIRRMHSATEYIDKDNPVLDQDYMVIFKDKELRKRISKLALIPNDYKDYTDEHHNQHFTNVELQLITEKEYELKNKRFHFILTDATVKDAICYAVKQLGIEKISLPEPKNTEKYVNLIIPPQQSFKSFMEFLQDRYGVYDEGCNFYYNGEIMFVYPHYKRTVTDCPETAHFYCTGDGSFQGMKFYHAKDQNNMYHIVINRTPVIKELIDAGAENIGNEILFEHAGKMIDLHSIIGEGKGGAEARLGLGEIMVKPDKTEEFEWDKEDTPERDYGIINNPKIQEFIFTNNTLKYKSRLKSYRGTICGFEWGTAEPYFLRPGYAVKWHIDGERDNYSEVKYNSVRDTMEYKTYDGIARSIIYKLIPAHTPSASRYPFSCTATIVLDLDYRKAKRMSDPAAAITNELKDIDEQSDSAHSIAESYDASPAKSSESVTSYDKQETTSERKDPVAVYLLSYAVVQDGMVSRRVLKWSDGTISYQNNLSDEIPKYKSEIEKNEQDLFNL